MHTLRPGESLYNLHKPGHYLVVSPNQNAEPKHGDKDPYDNCNVAEPESKRRSNQNWERNMETGPRYAVQDNCNRDSYVPNRYNGESLLP